MRKRVLGAEHPDQSWLNDGFDTVQEFPMAGTMPLTHDDIVNPYVPRGLFSKTLFDPLNYMWIDWYAVEQLQKYQFFGNRFRPSSKPSVKSNAEYTRLLSVGQMRPRHPLERSASVSVGFLCLCYGNIARLSGQSMISVFEEFIQVTSETNAQRVLYQGQSR